MGYSNDDMFMSLTTAKMLKELRDKNPGDKSKFLDIVEQTAPTLPHPHNQIFMDFVDAQRAYKPDPSKELHNFYHRMGAKSRRAKMLERATEQQVPNIAEYRQIYQQYNQPTIPFAKEM